MASAAFAEDKEKGAEIKNLKRELAVERARSAWARTLIPQSEFQKALNAACAASDIPLNDCQWNGSDVSRRPAPAPAPADGAKK